MRARIFVLFAAAMLLVTQVSAQQAVRSGEGFIPTVPSELLLVSVMLDHHPTLFEVDTGATLGLLSGTMAASLGLTRNESDRPLLGGADGQPLSTYTMVHALDIGAIHHGPARFVLPPAWRMQDARVTGLLGADVLSGWDLELDMPANRIGLYAPTPCCAAPDGWRGRSRAVPIAIQDGHILLPVTLDGQQVEALLDTGATHSSLSLAAAERLFALRPGGDGIMPVGATSTTNGGALKTYRKEFRTLEVGGGRFDAPSIDLIERSTDQHLAADHDFVLGLSELRQMHLYIAYHQKMLFIASD